jgi:hypothetical protein
MNWDVIGGLVRHLLTFGGGFLVTNGTITDGDLQAVVGGVIAIGGVIWSAFAKRSGEAA